MISAHRVRDVLRHLLRKNILYDVKNSRELAQRTIYFEDQLAM
jgi:predicted transcriptional regulator